MTHKTVRTFALVGDGSVGRKQHAHVVRLYRLRQGMFVTAVILCTIKQTSRYKKVRDKLGLFIL